MSARNMIRVGKNQRLAEHVGQKGPYLSILGNSKQWGPSCLIFSSWQNVIPPIQGCLSLDHVWSLHPPAPSFPKNPSWGLPVCLDGMFLGGSSESYLQGPRSPRKVLSNPGNPLQYSRDGQLRGTHLGIVVGTGWGLASVCVCVYATQFGACIVHPWCWTRALKLSP